MGAAVPARLRVCAGQITQAGSQRGSGQDAALGCVPGNSYCLETKGALFLVTDGIGGHAAGQVASRVGARILMQTYYASRARDVATSLFEAVQTANRCVCQLANERWQYRGMGATLAACALRGTELVVAHLGDSRVYLVRNARCWQLTRDHSWVVEAVACGLITTQDAARHPLGSIVTRYLGKDIPARVCIRRWRWQPGDRVVLCSDGLSKHVANWEIGRLANRHPPQRAALELLRLARRRGESDDIAVTVVRPEWQVAGRLAPLCAQSSASAPSNTAMPAALGAGAVGLLFLIFAAVV